MPMEIEPTTRPAGLAVVDSIRQRHLQLRTPRPVSPTETERSTFVFPVDVAYSFETTSLVFDQRYTVDIHDETGRVIDTLDKTESRRIDRSTHWVGFSGPMKLYCRFDRPAIVETGLDSVRLRFDETATVELGARAVHDRPAATIRTPDDPESMLEAVSALSSALKTTSPERSWPTLRGHPPLLERGPELEIPQSVADATPSTDVTIEIPPTYRALYTVAPLAFFLGATVRPGDDGRAVLETTAERYELGLGSAGDSARERGDGAGPTARQPFETAVARTLEQLFVLECIVRTEGLYPYDLRARTALEGELPFDLAETYTRPLADRIDRYLAVPYATVEPFVPRWPLTAHVPPTADGVEILPFVLDELGTIRTDTVSTYADTVGFDGTQPAATTEAQSIVRHVASSASDDESDGSSAAATAWTVGTAANEPIEHAWFGDGLPDGATKAIPEAYRRRLEREPRGDSIEVLVVCNDGRMIDEHDRLDDVYGTRETVPLEVSSAFGTSPDELASLLADGYDFLHFIGHATADGLECPTGTLDVRSLSTVDLGTFFLNACQSYEQGVELARRGAFGGVCTIADVVNEWAVTVGETIARLLNLGFPLHSAVDVVSRVIGLETPYRIVGDGSADVAQTDGSVPLLFDVDTGADGESFELSAELYATTELSLGSTVNFSAPDLPEQYLSPGRVRFPPVTREEFVDGLTEESMPILYEGSLRWTDGKRAVDLE